MRCGALPPQSNSLRQASHRRILTRHPLRKILLRQTMAQEDPKAMDALFHQMAWNGLQSKSKLP
jgi:hypothetical protein